MIYFVYVQLFGIDSFGNDIIDKFLRTEKTRHSKERIHQYEEKFELTQFVKTKAYQENKELAINIIDSDKDIFDEELYPVIVLIGQEENIVSRAMKKEYEEHCIIEIYTQDIETNNFKFITEDIDEIINLIRIITYTNDSKDTITSWNYNGLVQVREMLYKNIKKREYRNL